MASYEATVTKGPKAPPPPPDEAKVCTYGSSSVLDAAVKSTKVGQNVTMQVTGPVVGIEQSSRKGGDPYSNRTEIRLEPKSVSLVAGKKQPTMADDMNAQYKGKTGYGKDEEVESDEE